MAIAPPPPEERGGGEEKLILGALAGIAGAVPAEEIDEIWIFPPSRGGEVESVVAVAAAFVPEEPERRRVLTAHLTARREEPGKGARRRPRPIEPTVIEQGIAPADRIARVVDGVMRRLDEELAALTPKKVEIGGKAARWEELIEEMGGAPVKGE